MENEPKLPDHARRRLQAKVKEVFGGFVWRTQDGEELRPAEMRTTHLFYTVRMVFNHTAPACYRIPLCKLYAFNMPPDYLRAAILAIVLELKKRPASDLAPWQWDQLVHIATVCRDLATAKIN